MKGWVLLENGKIVVDANDAIMIFKTKDAILDFYCESLGDFNEIKRVEVRV